MAAGPDDLIRGIDRIEGHEVALVGGKAAALGRLSRIEGIRVPAGFCVTAPAFRRHVVGEPSITACLDQLAGVDPDDRAAVPLRSAEVRRAIERAAIPAEVAGAITEALAATGWDGPCAVRSSATAEDLPAASFAGQHDSYLDVSGAGAVLHHIRRCWASLFTERAVAYRLRHGFDHRSVAMAVVVQQMVPAHASGVLFTADPVTGNRRVASVEAVAGRGDALVSGRVVPDVHRVRDGRVLGPPGTVLTEDQVRRLVDTGRRIEAYAGRPQDVEWCLVGDDVRIVQSRPITTLFPVPETTDDELHVYVSVGHQQMMTDAMRPLGLSMWRLTSPAPMHEAGGRLFVDVTRGLASPASRDALIDGLGRSDPLIGHALRAIVDRGDLLPPVPEATPAAAPGPAGVAPRPEAAPGSAGPAPDREAASVAEEDASGPPSAGSGPADGRGPDEDPGLDADPALVAELIERARASNAAVAAEIGARSGPALLDFIRTDLQELRTRLFDPRSMQVIVAAMEASWWLNDQLLAWLGEKGAVDTLALSVPHNVTSEMGLALLDVADAIRPHPEVVAFLHTVADGDEFLDDLASRPGGREARAAIEGFLDAYGVRGVGEIDITRPRWRERPSALVPLILSNLANFEAGESRRRFERGRRAAEAKERDVLARLRAQPDGAAKAARTERMIRRLRTFSGYREHPKFAMVTRYATYKDALRGEADRLVQAGVLRAPDDIDFLTFDELEDVVRSGRADDELIDRRREELRSYQALVPPRVMTSDGEVVTGTYGRSDQPPGALVGLPVSAGTVEGRARVVVDLGQARLEPGDILVTTFTDPSWTPAFVAVAGLVTEVGGLMTHGAVIAREYGLPAVVGVEGATRLIRDGQRIRLHGTDGYVELLADEPVSSPRR